MDGLEKTTEQVSLIKLQKESLKASFSDEIFDRQGGKSEKGCPRSETGSGRFVPKKKHWGRAEWIEKKLDAE